MAILPTFPIEMIDKANALQLALAGFVADYNAANAAGQIPTEFNQRVENTVSSTVTMLANLSQSDASLIYFDVSAQLDQLIDQVNTLGRDLAQITGKPSRTAPYLDKYTSLSFGTLLSLAVLGVGGYFLYKWATKPDYYPRRKLPRYAGGLRAL